MPKIQVIVGGQFGSEGKGHLTAQLGRRAKPNSLVVRVGGPNAGHTVWHEGTEYKLRHLPTPVVRPDVYVALGAQSVIDPRVLRAELDLFPGRQILVDGQATILEPFHTDIEGRSAQMSAIGSTRKGIGAARVDRLRRQARTANDLWGEGGSELDERIVIADVAATARVVHWSGADILVEAAQGYGLGLHAGYYPYCTSADCTAIDALAQAQISPWAFPGADFQVWMAVRPFPIRVAGTSGPLENETSWDELGLPEERTTVTNKVRRVGHWDSQLVERAVAANGGPDVVRIGLLMADQVVPALANVNNPNRYITEFSDNQDVKALIAQANYSAPVAALGTGPDSMLFAEDMGRTTL